MTSCFLSASDLSFGNYTSNSTTPALGQTNLQLHCGPEITAEIALDAGTGLGGSTSRRKLTQESGVGQMEYGLYQDAGRTIHWGDRSGTDTYEVLTTGALQAVPIYGKIPAGQRVGGGTYSDVITITVHY